MPPRTYTHNCTDGVPQSWEYQTIALGVGVTGLVETTLRLSVLPECSLVSDPLRHDALGEILDRQGSFLLNEQVRQVLQVAVN